MKKVISVILFLSLILLSSLVLAETTKLTIRMDDQYNSLVRVKDGDTTIDKSPAITNYPMGLAVLEYDSSRSQVDYFVLIHQSGSVYQSYTLDDIAAGSDLRVDFREGMPPIITDLAAEAVEAAEAEALVEVAPVEEELENETVAPVEEEEVGFDFSEGLSTGKAIFYSSDSGFTVFSWILLGVLAIAVAIVVLGLLKNRQKDEVDKYKHELETIKRQIRKKIRDIKILKARGMKLKKMIELEEGFLEEKKGLGNIEKDLDEMDSKK
jgi:hypothetical protein